MKICLVEISAIVPATGAIQTIRLSSVGASSSAVILDNVRWLPFLTETPQTTVKVVEDGRINLTVDHGRIAFAAVGLAAVWRDLMFDGASARVFVGEEGAPFSAYEQHFEGTCGAHTVEKSIVSIPLVGRGDRLEKTNLLTSSFAGTGGVEGTSDIAGNLKPVCFGRALNIEPVLVDAAKQVYQVHDGAIDDIEMVFENALAVNSAPLTAANSSALYSMTIPEGQWAKCPNAGIFRLGGQPSSLVTADVRGAKIGGVYSANIATIATAILTRAGVLSAHIDPVTFAAFGDKSWSLYADTQMSVWEAVTTAFAHAAGIVFADETGVFRAGSYLSNATPTTLMADRSSLPLVIAGTTKQLEVSPPVWRLKYGHSRAWRVHTTSEISASIATISADTAANDAKAQAALDAAALAQAQADVATARLDAISSDNVLDRSDKAITIKEYQTILAEQPGITSQADGLGITVERGAYTAAITALTSYLMGLTPGFADMSADTVIVGATYRQRFVDVYTARQALLNRIAAIGNLSAYLTNESHLVAADAAGNVASFSGAGGLFVVNDGPNNVTSGVTYSVVSTAGLAVTMTGGGVYAASAMSADVGTAVLRATYSGQTWDKVFTVAKAIQGAVGPTGPTGSPGSTGAPAVTGYLTSESVALWSYANGNVVSYAPASTSFSVFSGNSNVTGNFALSIDSNPQGLTHSLSGSTLTIAGGFDPGEDVASITIKATGSGTYSGAVIYKTFSLSKVRGGYEIVNSLPGSDLFAGRMVYLTTDAKLYRYTGSAWTAAVSTGDLSGTITSTQISDGSIGTPKLAANAITADKIDVGAVTAAKLASTNLITYSAQINDGIITNAKIGNLQVDTIKIAGGAITANQVVTVADSYCAAGATIDFLTTGWMTIGDGTFGSGIININFTIDATVGYDSSCRVFLYVDTGDGMVLATQQSLGVTTNNGDSYSRTGGSISTVVSGAQVRVLGRMQSGLFIPRSVSRNQYIRDVTMTLMGAKR